MEGEVLVSVVIPVYNAEEFLFDSVESVRVQSWENLELILVDDGSTDQSGSICDSLAQKDSRIRVLHLKNGGVSRARNRGVAEAEGEYITFLDADDRMKPETISTLCGLLEKHGADIAVCGHEECISEGRRIPKFGTEETHVWSGKEIMREFLTNNRIGWNVWGKMFRRECIRGCEFPLDITIGEDMYFVFQACREAKTLCLYDHCLYEYRIRDGSAMKQKLTEKNFEVLDLIQSVYDETVKWGEEYGEMADCFFLRQSIWHLKFFVMRAGNHSSHADRIERIRSDMARYPIRIAGNLLRRKQLLEFILMTRLPGIFYLYMRAYKKVYEMLRT